jgi:hypothetical protein
MSVTVLSWHELGSIKTNYILKFFFQNQRLMKKLSDKMKKDDSLGLRDEVLKARVVAVCEKLNGTMSVSGMLRAAVIAYLDEVEARLGVSKNPAKPLAARVGELERDFAPGVETRFASIEKQLAELRTEVSALRLAPENNITNHVHQGDAVLKKIVSAPTRKPPQPPPAA